MESNLEVLTAYEIKRFSLLNSKLKHLNKSISSIQKMFIDKYYL